MDLVCCRNHQSCDKRRESERYDKLKELDKNKTENEIVYPFLLNSICNFCHNLDCLYQWLNELLLFLLIIFYFWPHLALYLLTSSPPLSSLSVNLSLCLPLSINHRWNLSMHQPLSQPFPYLDYSKGWPGSRTTKNIPEYIAENVPETLLAHFGK